MALTEMQELFCQEYLIDLSQTDAAKRAGFSAKTASVKGCQLMAMPEVRARVLELMNARTAAIGIDAKTVLEELLLIARSDLADAFDPKENTVLRVQQMPEKFRRAVASIKVTEEFEGAGQDKFQVGETREIKLWDKPKALELLARHLGLLNDKLEINDKTGIAKRLDAARARRIKNG